eukprot:352544-Chlamydomonas_euryale.AAC.8
MQTCWRYHAWGDHRDAQTKQYGKVTQPTMCTTGSGGQSDQAKQQKLGLGHDCAVSHLVAQWQEG